MNYFFVGKEFTFKKYFYKLKANEKNFTMLNFGENKEFSNCVNISSESGEFSLDFNFIFEYHIKRYGEESVRSNLIPDAGRLEKGLREILNNKDCVYACNSGDYCSRLIHKLSEEIGFEFYYLESGFLKNTYMKSKIPFIENAWYGKSDFELIYENEFTVLRDEDFWEEYLFEKKSKYLQNIGLDSLPNVNFVKPRHRYDGLFVGQLKYDTAIVLIDKKYSSSEEMAFFIANQNPNKFYCYKAHPKIMDLDQIEDVEKLQSVPNLDIVFEPIHDLFDRVNQVYCISSTVGIEALIHGKKVEFLGEIWYGGNINRIRLMNTLRQTCLPFETFH